MAHVSPLNVWPDLELVVIAKLRDFASSRVAGLTVDTAIGTNLVQLLPLIRVQLVPGGGEAQTPFEMDGVIDLTFFAADRPSMWHLAQVGNAAILQLSPSPQVDWVTVNSAPAYVDYGNPAIFRAEATYRLTARASGIA